jgi:hypothetical protein
MLVVRCHLWLWSSIKWKKLYSDNLNSAILLHLPLAPYMPSTNPGHERREKKGLPKHTKSIVDHGHCFTIEPCRTLSRSLIICWEITSLLSIILSIHLSLYIPIILSAVRSLIPLPTSKAKYLSLPFPFSHHPPLLILLWIIYFSWTHGKTHLYASSEWFANTFLQGK